MTIAPGADVPAGHTRRALDGARAAIADGRPRIALMTSYPPDHRTFSGGIESATGALLEGLRDYRDEFAVHVVSTSRTIAKDMREERDGINFHFLGLPRVRWARPRFAFRTLRMWQELRRIRPHLVHCQSNSAAALASMAGKYPRLATIHGVASDEAHLRTGWEFWAASAQVPLEKLTRRHFDHYICISSYAERSAGPGVHTYRIPNAVESRFFKVRRQRRVDEPYLLFAGVLAPLKRPADLVAAHARLRQEFPRLRTILCGPTEDSGYVESIRRTMAEQAIEGVELPGYTDRERLADLLSGASALVLPSAQENAPMVIAEAMAAGVPVIATRVGGVPDMVHDGQTGFLYQPGDVAALTSRLRAVLSDRGLPERLGALARRRAEQTYAPARVGSATAEVYRRLLQLQACAGSAEVR